jgi:hypothetical protein
MLPSKRLTAVVLAGLLAVLSTACVLGDVYPETEDNPVGTDHTVTAPLINFLLIDPQDFCDNLEDKLADLEGEELQPITEDALEFLSDECESGENDLLGPTFHHLVNFSIISGPNMGLNSDEHGTCDPVGCDTPNEDLEVSWTYSSNGIAGHDEILVCANPFFGIDGLPGFPPIGGGGVTTAQEIPPEFQELDEIITDVLNDTLDTTHESIVEFICQTVGKNWLENTPTPEPRERVERSVPNIGAGLSGLFAGQPTALPTAPAPVAVAPSQTIRPPNTGDAGLR